MARCECPECGATKGLRGEREDELVHISCGSCGHRWTHDAWRCDRCGGALTAVRKPLLQKARGTQQSIIGYRTVKECPRCDVDDDRPRGWMSASE